MSGCLACMVTDFLLRKNVIRREEREIYQYGYDMLFTGILQSMLLLAVGFILGKTAMTAVFVVVFTTLRRYTGGYHAKTRAGCVMATLFIYLFVLYMSTEDLFLFRRPAGIFLAFVFYAVSFLCCAPAENGNKPLDVEQKVKNKKAGGTLSVLYSIASTLLYRKRAVDMAVSVVTTMVCVALLMVIQKGETKCQKNC